MSTRELYRRRMMVVAATLKLTRQLTSERSVAEAMGIDPSYWQRIREGRLPDTDQIDEVAKKLGVPVAFFADPGLGDEPDFREYIGRTRVEREDGKGVPTVEGYIAMEATAGRHLEPELVAHLRAFHARTGDIELEDVLALVRSWRARQADRRVIERPPLETKIDEAKGQRKLEPVKKRGR